MRKLINLRNAYYKYLDKKARHIAYILKSGKPATRLLLKYISELYSAAKSESEFENGGFETAYHNPISSDLEFLIARILYHYSNLKDLDWKVFLRRQKGKTAPDVRIQKGKITVAIVEIKAKAGWIQPFFSSVRVKKDLKRLRRGESDFDPRDLIKRMRSQLMKYAKVYKIRKNKVFLLLPSLVLVHREKSNRMVKDYENDFVKNSGLRKENLILLSESLNLDLSDTSKHRNQLPTKRFENFVKVIERSK